jgi:hypothetical protein
MFHEAWTSKHNVKNEEHVYLNSSLHNHKLLWKLRNFLNECKECEINTHKLEQDHCQNSKHYIANVMEVTHALEGIMSFVTNKFMGTNSKWLYVWL